MPLVLLLAPNFASIVAMAVAVELRGRTSDLIIIDDSAQWSEPGETRTAKAVAEGARTFAEKLESALLRESRRVQETKGTIYALTAAATTMRAAVKEPIYVDNPRGYVPQNEPFYRSLPRYRRRPKRR